MRNAVFTDHKGLIRRLLLCWLAAALLEYCLLDSPFRQLPGTQGLAQMSFLRVLCVTAVGTAGLTVLALRWKSAGVERWAMAVIFGVLSLSALFVSYTPAFFVACMVLQALLVLFALQGWDDSPLPQAASGERTFRWPVLTALLAVVFFLFVSIWTVARVRSFGTPTFDFGIFAQMFHSMKTKGLPLTTLERDGLLSHFKVHVSPIYYLMLPAYAMVPRPETLQVLQALVMASAVIPLYKLAARHGLTGLQRMLLCAVLLIYPAYAGGAGYDLHENCFLTPLLMWLFYAVDGEKPWLTVIFALLTLMVKEDAAVYVAVIGLYVLLRAFVREERRRQRLFWGAALLMGAVAWFIMVTGYLAGTGDGVMTYRYNNFIYDGSGSLVTVIKAVFQSPMKLLFECMDGEKLSFLAATLLPLAGLPLLTRRYERYVLLIPYILINLMSDYQYQHHIMFQYSFGSIAFLFYLTLVDLADLKDLGRRTFLLIMCFMIGMGFFAKQVYPTAKTYIQWEQTDRAWFDTLRDQLDQVPADASVTATCFYTTYLSGRDVLYDVEYCSTEHLLETDYVVLQVDQKRYYQKFAPDRQDGQAGYDQLLALLEENGYIPFSKIDGKMEIYCRP